MYRAGALALRPFCVGGTQAAAVLSYPRPSLMNVLFVIAEMSPLVKVGGLADIGGGLPRALRRLGIDARVALPRYRGVAAPAGELVAETSGGRSVRTCDVAGVPVYLVSDPAAFDRPEVYGYEDDAERFLSFADTLLDAAAASAIAGALDWRPDVLHLNDWHAGFVAERLAAGRAHPWAAAARVVTIHNPAFTGPLDAVFVKRHGLAAPRGGVPDSALARAILHADLVTTVSPTYAAELVTVEYGWGLAPLLQTLGDRLCGVVNGIDVEALDPARDGHLVATYDVDTLDRRAENKRALQDRLGLAVDGDVPLLAMVSRLYWQKGSDLAAEALEPLLANGTVQFVVLGKGDEEHTAQLLELASRVPHRAAVRIDFDEPLGRLIFGGCDMLLMPSRYEPGGLGQIVAMRYGAIPVVRRTGGLADTVSPYHVGSERGSGFLFDQPTPQALRTAVKRAVAAFGDRPAWRRLQQRAMAQDFSWGRAAQSYREIYERAIDMRSEEG